MKGWTKVEDKGVEVATFYLRTWKPISEVEPLSEMRKSQATQKFEDSSKLYEYSAQFLLHRPFLPIIDRTKTESAVGF